MNMKRIVNLSLLAVLLLSGCTAEETVSGTFTVPPAVKGTVPLEVRSGSVSSEAAVTRATSTALGNGESIGIFLSGTGYTDVNNRQYTCATDVWGPAGGVANTIYLGGVTANVCAYHPYKSTNGTKTAIKLTSAPYSAADDLSYAVNRDMDGSSTQSSTVFEMTRAYARLVITLERSNYVSTGTVSKMELGNLLLTANLDITKSSGNYSATAGANGVTLTNSTAVTLPASGTKYNYADYLLVPCTPYGNQLSIKLTVDGKPMTTKVTYAPKAGEQKQLNIKVEGSAIAISSLSSIADWVSSSGGSFDSKLD